MKKFLIGTIIMLLLFSISVTGTYSQDQAQPNQIKTNQPHHLFEKDQNLSITFSQAPLFLGLNIDITNKGDNQLTDIKWNFRAKPTISGEGNVRRSNRLDGIIDQLNADETTTISLRPFSRTTPSPLGLSSIYMNVSAQTENSYTRIPSRANLVFFFLFGFKQTYLDIKPDEAYAKFTNDTFDLIIDVVGLDIYQQGHLPGAVNYVWADGTLQEEIPNLDKNWTYLVYCHTDPPSTASAQALVDAGIEKVYRLEGNYRAWEDAGYPIET